MLFVIVFLVAALIYSFFLLESLIKAEHDLDKVAWEADGKPRGFFGVVLNVLGLEAALHLSAFPLLGYLKLRRGPLKVFHAALS